MYTKTKTSKGPWIRKKRTDGLGALRVLLIAGFKNGKADTSSELEKILIIRIHYYKLSSSVRVNSYKILLENDHSKIIEAEGPLTQGNPQLQPLGPTSTIQQ